MAIQERNAFVLFIFDRKLNSFMHSVETKKEVFYDRHTVGWVAAEDGEDVVHIFLEEFRLAHIFFSRNFAGFI